jgi:nitrilase
MRVVKAAGVQMSPVLYSREGTVDKVVRNIHELGRQGVQFATFPETVVPYYQYFSFVQAPLQNIAGPEQRKLLDQAVTVPSPATDAMSEAARRAGVVVSRLCHRLRGSASANERKFAPTTERSRH